MNKLKLIAFLLVIPYITHTSEQTTDSDQAAFHELLQIKYMLTHTTLQNKSLAPSNDLTGNLQTLLTNRLQAILQKFKAQQISLLIALSQNNDALVKALNDPTGQHDARGLLLMSKEILSYISSLNTYITQASAQINQ